MSQLIIIGANLIAVSILVFGLYFPRYQRRDMIVAILGLNVGVMVVATALAASEVSAGLGLGLFGVLSIIRLRSSELAQEEIAYYFTALALGLLAGFQLDPAWMTPALMVLVLMALYVGDHPRLFAGNRRQQMQLDRAITDEGQIAAELGRLLGAEIKAIKVKRIDFVRDTTTVDVRYRLFDDPNGELLSGDPAGGRVAIR